MSGDLKFDKMDMDTKQAQEYLASQNSEYHSNDFEETNSFILDALNNKIYASLIKQPKADSTEKCVKAVLLDSLDFVSSQLERGIELICELEYMIRRRPVQGTKLDLEMVMKNLLNDKFIAECSAANIDHIPRTLVMRDDSSLMGLGCIAQMLPITIMATKNCAVVCHLFRELCRKAGIKEVSLAFIADDEAVESNIFFDKVLQGGCVGVVTAASDVDSAVETFLTAPTHDPWGFRHILVQESACDRFKKTIAWKTKLTAESVVDPELKRLSSNVYVYGNKVFVREYVGDRCKTLIVIEEFRTVKELMSLIDCKSPFCVSLWSSDVSESHEISYGITAPLVWVNDYGVLGVPLRISEAYYSRIYYVDRMNPTKLQVELCRRQKEWVKLTLEERRREVLFTISCYLNDENSYKRLVNKPYDDNNFVQVSANSLIVGIQVPCDIYTTRFDVDKEEHNLIFFKYLIKVALRGSGLLVYVSGNDKHLELANYLNELTDSLVPVAITYDPNDLLAISSVTQMRIIHSSFGTIFAN